MREKTTTLECIEDLRKYDGGAITVNGKNGDSATIILCPPISSQWRLVKLFAKWNKTKIDATMLNGLGIKEMEKKQYIQLSTGQKRRLHLALFRSSHNKSQKLKFRIANTLTVRLFSRFTFSFSVVLPGTSYWIPAVVLRPVHSSPTARYRLHNGYTVRPVCGTPSRIHSDIHLLRVGIDFLPAESLPLSLLQHRFPSPRFSDIALPSV